MKRFAFVTLFGFTSAALVFLALGTARGQQPAATKAPARPAAKEFPEDHRPPLFFREPWRHPPGPAEHPLTQDSVSNPNLELKLYGDQPKPDPDYGGMWENRRDQPKDDPVHIYTGTCRTPCALALRDRDNSVDLTGLAKIKWRIRQSHFHLLHPIIKLGDGTWLIGDHGDGYSVDYHDVEFAISDVRWLRLDISRVVATGDGSFVEHPDLTHVDEIGFADLVPGSGHGSAGRSNVSTFEVWGTPVPRAAKPGSK
jgi:hypothetical protein